MGHVAEHRERSDRDQLHVSACGLGEVRQIVRVGREDFVTIDGQQNDCGVDDIGAASEAEENTDSPAERLIDGVNIEAGQQAGEVRLATLPATPHLADDATVGQRRTALLAFPFDEGHDVAVTTLDCQQRPGVKDNAHAAPRFVRRRARGLSAGGVRTTTARPRVRRVASRISSSVIWPCSAS